MKIAVPTEAPGGIEAKLGEHFGRSDTFTLVTIEDDEVKSVEVITNERRGCLGVVAQLRDAGAEAVVVRGMGMRPLVGFKQAGIAVHHHEGAETAGQAAALVALEQTRQFDPSQACGGGKAGHRHGGGCGGHHGGN